MKESLKNNYIKNYLLFVINLFAIEIIFKLVSGENLFVWSTLRIFIGVNIISFILTGIISFMNHLWQSIIRGIVIFIAGVYACAQAGFYNFLGVYMSFQTSSQLGAVVDYIKDFIRSFSWTYFLTLMPFIILLIWQIFFDKKEYPHLSKLKTSGISILATLFFSFLYYISIELSFFQAPFQIINNHELFLTVSNPSMSIAEFGTTSFAFLDLRAMLFPVNIVTNMQNDYLGQNDDDPESSLYKRDIDDTALREILEGEKNSVYKNILAYFLNRDITDKNAYTGMFKDKNLIVIMMESVNDIILDSEYYPNFARILEHSWYWKNNYSPRNSCATMNNEFSGMTSLYSIYNTCTASKYKSNTYYESIFNLFNDQDYVTFSAHDYTEAYYPRKTIHKNMGSKEYFGVQKLGIPYSNEYINWANDDDFMKAILNIIDDKTADDKPFMTWLTTVSSHQPYGVSSIQGDKYYDMTQESNYPKDVRHFMSKLKILDNGLGILLDGLEEKGILDDTVIVLYGDHYPYGISTTNLNKVLDYDTKEDLNAERVPFVIYNSKLEAKTFDDYTYYVNLLPTIANLFDLEYDPRFYLGTDLLSDDYTSLVVFADGSWKNEFAFYDASSSKIKYYTDFRYTAQEIKDINADILAKTNQSSLVIKNNYFNYLENKLQDYNEDNNCYCPLED